MRTKLCQSSGSCPSKSPVIDALQPKGHAPCRRLIILNVSPLKVDFSDSRPESRCGRAIAGKQHQSNIFSKLGFLLSLCCPLNVQPHTHLLVFFPLSVVSSSESFRVLSFVKWVPKKAPEILSRRSNHPSECQLLFPSGVLLKCFVCYRSAGPFVRFQHIWRFIPYLRFYFVFLNRSNSYLFSRSDVCSSLHDLCTRCLSSRFFISLASVLTFMYRHEEDTLN